MLRILALLPVVLCLAASGKETAPLPKNERLGVWQAPKDGIQIPLWPADVVLAKPDTGERPEATGNGTGLVAGRKWHWASYVTRPTMTLFRPKWRNNGAAVLVRAFIAATTSHHHSISSAGMMRGVPRSAR